MALSNDFEARRRARLKEQRRRRERMNKIKRIVFVAFCLLILIILIVNISKCGKKKSAAPAPTPIAAATAVPSEEPAAEILNGIPAPEKGDNSFLTVLQHSGQTKKAYLTFEGGPDKTVTPEILDTLRRYNVKATFFVTGKNIEDEPSLCARIIEEGHLVLPLSYSGNTATLYADKDDFIDEIDKTYELICDNSISSVKPFKIYRFPDSSNSDNVTKELKDALAENGYYYCDYNTTVGDADSKRTSEQLLTYFKNNKPELNNLVIQLRNTSANEATAQMLEPMIKSLLEDGRSFSRLDEVDLSNASDELLDKAKDTEKTDEDDNTPDNSVRTSAPSASATKKPAAKVTAKPVATAKPASKATAKPSSSGTGSSGTDSNNGQINPE